MVDIPYLEPVPLVSLEPVDNISPRNWLFLETGQFEIFIMNEIILEKRKKFFEGHSILLSFM